MEGIENRKKEKIRIELWEIEEDILKQFITQQQDGGKKKNEQKNRNRL